MNGDVNKIIEQYEWADKTLSYHIACESKLNAFSSEFEELKLKALEFACFRFRMGKLKLNLQKM